MTTTLASFPKIAFDIHFGKGGNAEDYQHSGLSFAETGFTWSLGESSKFQVPLCAARNEILLILEGSPFIYPPGLSKQRVVVAAAGMEVASFEAQAAFVKSLRLNSLQNSTQPLVIEFRYLDRVSPSKFAGDDRRELAIAWRRIRIAEVPRQSVASRDKKAREHVSRPGRKTQLNLTSSNIEMVVLEGLRSGETALAASAVESLFRKPGIRIDIDPSLTEDISVVRCMVDQSGRWTVGFSFAWIGRELDEAARMVVWHWLATLPIFAAYSESGRVSGSFQLSLGDEAHCPGVAFCSNTSETFLIPDPYFMRSFGYRELEDVFTSQHLPFVDRIARAMWRGSTTGYRGSGGLLELARVRLCMRALQPDAAELIDAGFSRFVQLQDGEEQTLCEMGLARAFIAPEQLPQWMLHIDIDGNTNSWPGLFQKLLSGSVVLKVESAGRWRQWYYDRLEDYINIIPVEASLADLVDKVKYFVYRVDEANAIAEASKRLALSMSYKGEIRLAVATLEEAIVQDWLRGGLNGLFC